MWLEEWIGKRAFKRIRGDKKRHGSNLMSTFETNKFQFTGEEDEMGVRLPADCGITEDETLNIDDSTLMLTKYVKNPIFEMIDWGFWAYTLTLRLAFLQRPDESLLRAMPLQDTRAN